ncbi:HDOD domain-containing protein [Marinobacteraceae bacterium S3BR75-40.1]
MSLPASLQHAFAAGEQAAIDPELIETAAFPATREHLTMVLLGDSEGRLQAIIPTDCLLDVDRLNQATGRSLRALSLKEVRRLQGKYQLQRIPPVPRLTGLETIVARQCDECAQVCFESGASQLGLRLERAQFQAMVGDAKRLDIAVPLSQIAINLDAPEKDLDQIARAVEKFTSMRIQQRLEDTLELPPLPETAQRIIHLRVDPNAEVGDLADIVEADPSLAAQVVSWASSSFYAAPSPVQSIYDAIMRVLGFELVMNLAMGLSLGRTLQQPKDAPDGYMGYWQGAIWMAQAAGAITSLMPRKSRPAYGLAYLSGLLHNFGYMVLAHIFPPHFSLICRYVEANRHVDTAYIEHYLLGLTREQIGSQLMQVWGMPDEVVTALRHQKNPDFDGENAAYSRILHLGRQMLIARGIDLGPKQPIDDNLFEQLELARDEVEEAMDELVDNRESVFAMAGMMQQG